MRRIIWLLKQLLPCMYRRRYWDEHQQPHFAVWRQWFGFVFAVDDVVVLYDFEMAERCVDAFNRSDAKTLQRIADEVRIRSMHQRTLVEEASALSTVPTALPMPERMQSLKLANDLWDNLALGQRVTVRAGRRDIELGPLMLESALPGEDGRYLQEVVEVVEVVHKRLRDLSDIEAEEDGSTDADELKANLRRFYPALHEEDEITLIYFAM